MSKSLTLSTIAVATAMAVVPALAQTAPSGATGGGNAMHSTVTPPAATTPNRPVSPNGPNTAANTPSARNPILTDSGDVRASKMIGSDVYNDQNQVVGTVDDVLLGKDNKPTNVVLSVGGFLGMGSKLVAVPYDKLQFGDTSANANAGNANNNSGANANAHRIIMPGATKEAINGMPNYQYTNANGTGTNNKT